MPYTGSRSRPIAVPFRVGDRAARPTEAAVGSAPIPHPSNCLRIATRPAILPPGDFRPGHLFPSNLANPKESQPAEITQLLFQSASKRYKCRQSEQYEKSITCKFTETKDVTTKVITIMHLYNNIVTYINESVSPAAFTNVEVGSELRRLSGRFGSSPHIESSPEGVIATWGDIKLQRLPRTDLAILTQNKNPNLGFYG